MSSFKRKRWSDFRRYIKFSRHCLIHEVEEEKFSTLKNINGAKVAIEDSSYQYDRFSKIANIHDEIMAMLMNYETLLGELGNSLSGG